MTEQTALTRTNGHTANDVMTTMPAVQPNVDIFENEQELIVDCDLPGVAQDTLSVHLDGTQLTLEGERAAYEGWSVAARYRRTFTVPEHLIDADGVEAEFRGGVLRVRLPKRDDARPRKITVRSVD